MHEILRVDGSYVVVAADRDETHVPVARRQVAHVPRGGRHLIRRAAATAILLVAVVLGAVVPAFGQGERSIGVSAASFDFGAAAGEAGEGEVWVSNDGEEPITVRVYAANQVVDDQGSVTYVAPSPEANPLQSPASWMTVALPPDAKSIGNVPYVALEPGERAKVDFRVDIPQGALPGDHNILLFFEMFDPNPSGDAGEARNFGRLGTRVKARVEGEIIESIEAAPFVMPVYVLGSTVPYDLTVSNKGNVDERANVRLIQLDQSDTELAASDVMTDTAVYAGSSVRREGSVENAGPGLGAAHFKLVVTYPSRVEGANGLVKSVEEERTVWVIPAWLPIALAAALAVLIGAAIWAAGRRSAERRAAKAQASEAIEPLGPVE